MKLARFFLPHPQTHQKAHLLNFEALAIYVALLVLLQISFGFIKVVKPEILGVSSDVNQQELIRLTNEERAKQGLPTLKEDPRLDEAANKKARNMFEENYWAHYSPSGKDPWVFISGASYKFVYAGENLARNFYNSKDIIEAWMASPTHRDNIINSKYRDIGIAVVEGNLNGQPTLLVVQEFGAEFEPIAQNPEPTTPPATTLANSNAATPPQSSPSPLVQSPIPTALDLSSQTSLNNQQNLAPILAKNTQTSNKPLVLDSYLISRNLGVGTIIFLISLITLDLYIIRKRGIYRIASRHLPHLALMAVAATSIINSQPGAIL